MCISITVDIVDIKSTVVSTLMSSCVTACVGGADNELVCQLLQDAIFDDVSLSPGSRSLLLNYSKIIQHTYKYLL